MTNEQKIKIAELRQQGFGYTTIADTLNISKGAVRSFCQRNNLGGVKAATHITDKPDGVFCKECGAPLVQPQGRKPVKFCSKQCRVHWWNKNLDKVNRKALYSFTCSCCGKEFTAYGNNHRKYCSHECYIRDRYKGGECHEA